MSPISGGGWRHLFAWLLIAQQIVIGAGVSVPCEAAGMDSAGRYPCEHCGCGCRTAEDCWRRCCCHTNVEKVAWAERHGVAVPSYVVAAAGKEAAEADESDCARCQDDATAEVGGACRSIHGQTGMEPPKSDDHQASEVSWVGVMGCRGLTVHFAAIGPNWPGDRHIQARPCTAPTGRTSLMMPLSYSFTAPPPPTPPPKGEAAGTV